MNENITCIKTCIICVTLNWHVKKTLLHERNVLLKEALACDHIFWCIDFHRLSLLNVW